MRLLIVPLWRRYMRRALDATVGDRDRLRPAPAPVAARTSEPGGSAGRGEAAASARDGSAVHFPGREVRVHR